MSTNDDNTLGFTLELYSRYMEAAKVCQLFSAFSSIIEPWGIIFARKEMKLFLVSKETTGWEKWNVDGSYGIF